MLKNDSNSPCIPDILLLIFEKSAALIGVPDGPCVVGTVIADIDVQSAVSSSDNRDKISNRVSPKTIRYFITII